VLRCLRGIALLFSLFAVSPLTHSATFRDDRGIAITLETQPTRIVALSPHLTELSFAAGAGPQLVAVVRYSDYPAQAARLPQVGDASRIDVERVLALKPDLILAWQSGNPAGDVERLERLGFKVFVSEAKTLADVSRLLRTIGALAGTNDAAHAAAAAFDHELAALRVRYSGGKPVPVFYEIWHQPLLTVNGAHVISDVIALCGGRNVFERSPMLTPAVSFEAVLAARPRVVLGGSSAARPGDFVALWRTAPVGALREIPVRYVPPDLIQRHTPRMARGAKVVCEHLEEIRKLTK
jgi:iron complex transport system substrate-binding protein